MKILITGGNGQLGNELNKIITSGYSEIGPVPNEYLDAEVIATDISDLDITNKTAVNTFFFQGEFDIIFNCAAMTNVDGCESDPELAMKVNAIGAGNIAAAADEYGCRLVHVSTDYVFAGKGESPYREWDLTSPCTVYGKSKLLGEKYISLRCKSAFIVRTAWLYGYEGNNFVKTIMRLANENKTVKVVNDQVGNPTNANDLAHHLLKLAVTENYGIYHCVGQGACSWFEFAEKIVQYSGIDAVVNSCTTSEFPRPAKRPAYSSLDNLMLCCTVGDEMRSWQDALKYYIDNR